MKLLPPKLMVQKRMQAKKANVHQNPGMKSNSPAGAVGTKRASRSRSNIHENGVGAGGVAQKFAAVKKGAGVSQQPKVKARKANLKNSGKGFTKNASSSFGGKIVSIK